MSQTTHRDPQLIAPAFGRWIGHRKGAEHVAVGEIVHPSVGYSSETMLIDVTWSAEGRTHDERLVIRMAPPMAGTFGDYDVLAQGQAQAAASSAGIPVANPTVEADPGWLGAPFVVMDRIDGRIIGELPLYDEWLRSLDEPARAGVHRRFIETVADIHRVDTGGADRVPRRDNAAELAHWSHYLDWSSGGDPVGVLVDALAWCRAHRPVTESEAVLLWGDVRFENMVLADDGRPLAVLDWDMTSVGAPEHDVAWFTALDLTSYAMFGRRLAGFPDRGGTIASYEAASGRTLHDLEWYETLALLRSTAIMTRIGYLRRDAGEPTLLPIDDNPLLDLLRDRLG